MNQELSNYNIPVDSTDTPCIALRKREAAKSLGISERTLHTLTQNGDVPHYYIGAAVVYPVASLNSWACDSAEKGVKYELPKK